MVRVPRRTSHSWKRTSPRTSVWAPRGSPRKSRGTPRAGDRGDPAPCLTRRAGSRSGVPRSRRTLHDCLLTDQAHVGAFSDILREEYRAVFGPEVVPTLSAKPF